MIANELKQLETKKLRLLELQELEAVLSQVDPRFGDKRALYYTHVNYIRPAEHVRVTVDSLADVIPFMEKIGVSEANLYKHTGNYAAVFAPCWHETEQVTHEPTDPAPLHVRFSFCIQEHRVCLESFRFFTVIADRPMGITLELPIGKTTGLARNLNFWTNSYGNHGRFCSAQVGNGQLTKKLSDNSTDFKFYFTLDQLKELLP